MINMRVMMGMVWLMGTFIGKTVGAQEAPAPQKVPPPVHAISMYGDIKYPQNFKGFSVFNLLAPKGGTLRLHVVGQVFDTLNPFLFKGLPAAGLGLYSYLPFDPLMDRAPEEAFGLYPRLAKLVQMPEDRSWIIFTLREEARFHDGTPVTTEDVLFTYNCLKEHGSPTRKELAKKVKSIEILSPHEIKFTFNAIDGQYDRELPLIIAMMPITSKKFLEGKSFAETGMTPLMGSGPYRVAEVIPGKSITYERVKDYWGKDLPVVQGLYNFDKIVFEYFGTEMVAFEGFKSGEIDFWHEQDLTRWGQGYGFPAVQRGDVVREEVDYRHVVGMTALAFNTRRDLFKDQKVREALGLLLNFEWMNKNLFHNAYNRTQSFFQNTEFEAKGPASPEEKAILDQLPDVSPAVFGVPPVQPKIDASFTLRDATQKAQDMLAEAGWVMREGRLVNEKTGKPFVFEILLNDPKREKVVSTFADNLEKKLGIQVTVRTVDSAQYQHRLQNFDFDMIVHFWGHSLSPGIEQHLYWASAFADIPSRNYAGIRSKAIDAVCARIGEAHTREELCVLIRVLDRLLRHGAYVIPLFHRTKEAIAYWKHIQHPPFNPALGLPTIYSWWHVPQKGKTGSK